MKLRTLALAFLVLLGATAFARNNTVTVAKVSESIDIKGETDYVITDESPFDAMGSVNIAETEHATVIFQKVRPSRVIANLMQHIFINGEPAVNGTNCQVKMFNRGAIVFPYSKNFRPLTCYTEENYGGESQNNYGMGHSGGFMNTLTTTQLNNNIRSFKLKRGYMVTFAVGVGGWGYSRCFIADLEDLEIPIVPAPLNGKISSYRLFHWYNASKAGIHDTSWGANNALNTTSCFDWGQGNASLLPDVEWVPNHIYEDWPSAATCGSVTGSCHMKTNNEPGNSADDHPQDVATVLNNWENLMRTGLRLCSESSHDGSMDHLKTFINEVDKRGWRCDILDLHCYWNAGTFNSLTWYSNEYGKGRPIWISEWVWGSSWGHNGFWGAVEDPGSLSANNQRVLLDNTRPILETMNANPRVERYFYWNSEAVGTRIYYDGSLTQLGKYYATMETGLAYNPANEYIPKIVYSAPSALNGNYTKKTATLTLEWTDPNGDMLDSIIIERKGPGSTRWQKLDNIAVKDKSAKSDISYTYTTIEKEIGISYYRFTEYYDGGKKYISNEYSITVAAAQSVGLLQYGQLKVANDEAVSTDLEPSDTPPYVVMGMISNKNAGNGITNQIQSISKNSFKYRLHPWTLESPVEIKSAETIDYLVLPADTIIHLSDEMMLISQNAGKVKGDEIQVVFPEAFPEGVTPVVVAQQNTTISSYAPVVVKVSNITNQGFTIKLARQEKATGSFSSQNVNYFACTPGQIKIGQGKLLTVGTNKETPCGGSARQNVAFVNETGDTLSLINPTIIAAPQTNNYGKTSVFRIHSTTADEQGGIYTASIRRQVDGTSTVTTTNSASANGDYIGWFIISDDPDSTGDEDPLIVAVKDILTHSSQGFSVSVSEMAIHSDNALVRVYNAAGQAVQLGKKLPRGFYIVTDGKNSVKVQVR